MKEPREFWMDTDLLDKALDSCDLGDGYMAKVRQYPHKDHVKYYTKVREVLPSDVDWKGIASELALAIEGYKNDPGIVCRDDLFEALEKAKKAFDGK